jgi:hypothetical protein
LLDSFLLAFASVPDRHFAAMPSADRRAFWATRYGRLRQLSPGPEPSIRRARGRQQS